MTAAFFLVLIFVIGIMLIRIGSSTNNDPDAIPLRCKLGYHEEVLKGNDDDDNDDDGEIVCKLCGQVIQQKFHLD